MSEEATRMRLGRGLAALLGDVGEESAVLEKAKIPAAQANSQVTTNSAIKRVPIEYLRANPLNPRKVFHKQEIEELGRSIKERGMIQPIVVRRFGSETNAYEIIAGERRWRAAQYIGLVDVPVILNDMNDKQALEVAIVENVQRSDLNAMEEAAAYQQLIDGFGYTQDQLAQVIGKSRPHIANTLRLMKLPESVQAYVRQGEMSAGHARALLGSADIEKLAEQVVLKGLSVREAEQLAKGGLTDDVSEKTVEAVLKKSTTEKPQKDADTRALEKALTDHLGLVVEITHRGDKGGDLCVTYKTLEQLDEVCKKLKA